MRYQNYFVYIVTNGDRHTVLYIGVTNSLERRANEHSLGLGSAFARQYNAHKLIYFEAYPDPTSAIAREKQLKHWSHTKKGSAYRPKKSGVARFVYRDVRFAGNRRCSIMPRDPSTALRSARDDERAEKTTEILKKIRTLEIKTRGLGRNRVRRRLPQRFQRSRNEF